MEKPNRISDEAFQEVLNRTIATPEIGRSEAKNGFIARNARKIGAAAVTATIAAGSFVGIGSMNEMAENNSPQAYSQNAELPSNYDFLPGINEADADNKVHLPEETLLIKSTVAKTPNGDCKPDTGKVIFYSESATGNKYGLPVVGETVDEVRAELYGTMCYDPAALTSTAEDLGLYTLDQSSRDAKIHEYLNNEKQWNEDFKQVIDKLENETKSWSIENKSGTYTTGYQIDSNKDGVPEVVKGLELTRDDMRFLKIEFKDGTVKHFKLECHFQPAEFSGETPVETPVVTQEAPVETPVETPVDVPEETPDTTPTTQPSTTTTQPTTSTTQPSTTTTQPTTTTIPSKIDSGNGVSGPGGTTPTTFPAPAGEAVPDRGEVNPVGTTSTTAAPRPPVTQQPAQPTTTIRPATPTTVAPPATQPPLPFATIGLHNESMRHAYDILADHNELSLAGLALAGLIASKRKLQKYAFGMKG